VQNRPKSERGFHVYAGTEGGAGPTEHCLHILKTGVTYHSPQIERIATYTQTAYQVLTKGQQM